MYCLGNPNCNIEEWYFFSTVLNTYATQRSPNDIDTWTAQIDSLSLFKPKQKSRFLSSSTLVSPNHPHMVESTKNAQYILSNKVTTLFDYNNKGLTI